MILRENNIYAHGYVIELPDGNSVLLRDDVDYTPSVQDKIVPLVDGVLLDALAYTHYSPFKMDASKYWFIIADANVIEEPMILDGIVNTDIIVPDINNYNIQL